MSHESYLPKMRVVLQVLEVITHKKQKIIIIEKKEENKNSFRIDYESRKYMLRNFFKKNLTCSNWFIKDLCPTVCII